MQSDFFTKTAKFILFLVLALLTTVGCAAELSSFNAHYLLLMQNIPAASVNCQLSVQNGHYQYTFYAAPLLPLTHIEVQAKSSGSIIKHKVIPSTYHQISQFNGHRTQLEVKFEPNGFIVWSNGRQSAIKSSNKVLDPLATLLQAQLDLQRNIGPLRYHVIWQNRIQTFQFSRLGHTELTLNKFGDLATVLLQKQGDQADQKNVVWLAKKWHYLPVKVFSRQQANIFTVILTSLSS